LATANFEGPEITAAGLLDLVFV